MKIKWAKYKINITWAKSFIWNKILSVTPQPRSHTRSGAKTPCARMYTSACTHTWASWKELCTLAYITGIQNCSRLPCLNTSGARIFVSARNGGRWVGGRGGGGWWAATWVHGSDRLWSADKQCWHATEGVNPGEGPAYRWDAQPRSACPCQDKMERSSGRHVTAVLKGPRNPSPKQCSAHKCTLARDNTSAHTCSFVNAHFTQC